MPYVELAARSHFSFLLAASSPQELVETARALGHDTIAIVDRDGLYGMVRAWEACKEAGVRLVVGCELSVSADGEAPYRTLLVHVENHAGYTNLCGILTESHRLHPKGQARDEEGVPRNLYAGVPLAFVCEHADGLWASLVPSSVAGGGESAWPLEDAGHVLAAFGARTSLAVHRHLDGDDDARVRQVRELSRSTGIPIVATNAVRYARREEKPLFDVLHCIREGTTLDAAGRALSPNTEACLKSHAEMARVFADRPEWILRAIEIGDACRFSLSELKYRFPSELEEPAYPGETPNDALRRLAHEGARRRYASEGEVPARVTTQIDKELALIAKLDVAPYFLSVRTIVEMARRRDILCQGRGSAANSAVCYCLGITAVDPARASLLFERFLSAERNEPPDIDVDFEHERREEVIQEIYARYGRDRAAMVSEIISYRGKSALREVGKAFGLSLEQVDRLSAVVTHWDSKDAMVPSRLREAGFDANDARIQQVLTISQALYGTPRHLSIHVGGFVLSSTSLTEIAPIEPATMADRTVIPWDKDDLDTLGFFKVDVLALGMLTAIRKALDFLGDELGEGSAIDRMARIPAEDPAVYDALCKADTVGVFQIESRAQMSMLPRLKPRTFYDLVVEVAIVRPGPIQGGMVHPYLRRRSGEEAPDSPHPILAPILERTLGVPLFQEQVMQLAIVGAGYTGGQADQLRRDMAAWKKNGRLERHRERLVQGFAERGVTQDFAERLYKQIQGFGEYGFPESHAASFALLVYASSWLKVHYPAAFAAALVNSQPMGFYSPSSILEDARRHDVPVRAICIDKSMWDCTLEGPAGRPEGGAGGSRGGAIRVGLRQVKGLGEESGRRIEAAKAGGRPFLSIEDLIDRARLKKNEVEALAEAGALEAILQGRREAMWKVRAPRLAPGAGAEAPPQASLFAGMDLGDAVPKLPKLTRSEQLVLDYERTGLSVADHPMRIARPQLPKGTLSSKELMKTPHGAWAKAAGLVICRQRPGTASGVVFVTMEDEEGFINLILWARVFEKLRHVATTSGLLLAQGKVERQEEVVYIVVDRLERVRMGDVTRMPHMSRDFH
jgi:error-prone DNA polymerase